MKYSRHDPFLPPVPTVPSYRKPVGKIPLYAVGEMVLVVIGIPIALQVDNWNEDRNEKVREANLLKELVKNNEYNNENIGRYIKGKDRYNNYSD